MTRTGIIPAIKAALEAAAYFSAVEVIANDFSQASIAAMEEELRATGAVVAIPPLLGSKLVGQSANRVVEVVNFVVQLRVNRNVQIAELPTFDPYAAHDAIIAAVVGVAPLEIKAGDSDGNMTALVLTDTANLTHGIHFSVQIK